MSGCLLNNNNFIKIYRKQFFFNLIMRTRVRDTFMYNVHPALERDL